MDILNRAKSANGGAKATLNEKTATANLNNANTTYSIVDSIRKENLNKIKSSKKKRINVSLEEEVFHKLITLANGGSVSAVMEELLTDMVKNEEINEEVVSNYIETMKNKGQKPGTPKKKKKKSTKASNEEESQ